MHPPLAEHKHPSCLEYISALEECHRAGFLNRLTGKCNGLKLKLNECLGEEFQEIRKANAQKAKAARKKVEEAWREFEEPPKNMDA